MNKLQGIVTIIIIVLLAPALLIISFFTTKEFQIKLGSDIGSWLRVNILRLPRIETESEEQNE